MGSMKVYDGTAWQVASQQGPAGPAGPAPATLLLSGIASGTTNAGAFLSFPFPTPFAANPQVFVQNIVQQTPYLFCLFPASSTVGQVAFTMHLPTGAGAANTAYSVFWLAIGPPVPS